MYAYIETLYRNFIDQESPEVRSGHAAVAWHHVLYVWGGYCSVTADAGEVSFSVTLKKDFLLSFSEIVSNSCAGCRRTETQPSNYMEIPPSKSFLVQTFSIYKLDKIFVYASMVTRMFLS